MVKLFKCGNFHSKPEAPSHRGSSLPSTFVSQPATLLRRVEQDYGGFGLENPNEYAFSAKASLLSQLKVVEWYAQKSK